MTLPPFATGRRAPASRRRARLRPVVAWAALAGCLAGPVAVAGNASASATESAPDPLSRVFAADSFWYRELPAHTPTDPRSAEMVAHIVAQAEDHYGSPGNPNVNVNLTHYTPPIYVAHAGDPAITFTWENCQHKVEGDHGLIEHHLTDVRLPAGAVPAEGSDSEMVVYDETADRLVETWVTTKEEDGSWRACWGGSIEEVSRSDGIFEAPFGVTASGLPLLGGTIRAAELERGRIDHVVGIALPFAAEKPTLSWPATRSDGRNPSGRPAPAQGQMLRLPADLDLDALALSPVARTIAEAAQTYGLVVWDTSGAVSFRAQNPLGMADHPYREVFRGRGANAEMAGDRSRGEVPFPLEQLQVLPMDYAVPTPEPTASRAPVTAAPRGDDDAAGGVWVVVAAAVGGAAALLGAVSVVRRRAERR